MAGSELWQKSATELAALIADGDVKSREVVDAHLDRIAAVNGRLNAITVVREAQARAEADRADTVAPTGPLHGVPFTVKENIDQVDHPTTNGLAVFADAHPPLDAVTFERMRAAGAIPIGRTNMPELGLRVATDNSFRGLTRNPWHHDRTAGGSSGGEGAAIASGMSPIGLGNDIGGSIRNPALCCGIVGLKPGFGRIPRVSSLPPEDAGISGQLMAVEGPLARSIADLRLALDILAGPSPRDPTTAAVPVEGPTTERRAGIVRSVPDVVVDPGALAAVDGAADAMRASGWEVEEVEAPELARVREVWTHLLAFDIQAMMPMLEQIMGESEVAGLHTVLQSIDSEALPPHLVLTERHRLQRAWSAMFVTTPVVIGPGWTKPPFEHGADVEKGQQMQILEDHLGFIVPANILSLPAVAITTGTYAGLPTGVQVYADRWREDLCLEGAQLIEDAVGVLGPIDPVWS